MAKQFESFILGSGKTPEWFDKVANAGKVKQIFDEDGEVIETHIASGTKVYVAHEGDTVINTSYGLVVLDQQDAKKYGVQRKDDQVEKSVPKKKDEETNA